MCKVKPSNPTAGHYLSWVQIAHPLGPAMDRDVAKDIPLDILQLSNQRQNMNSLTLISNSIKKDKANAVKLSHGANLKHDQLVLDSAR